jgi:Raf kinase inhibitor-like YbhB/YbcL family protein
MPALELTSPDFADGSPIPRRHAYRGEGDNHSPELRFAHVPAGTVELALVCDDPDAPSAQPWVHWVVWGLAPEAPGIPGGAGTPTPELAAIAGARQGRNDFGELGWGGPLPPRGHGTHHYRFRLHALDQAVQLAPGASRDDLVAAVRGHLVAEAVLNGLYERR